MKKNSRIVIFFKFVVPFRGGLFDYLPHVPNILATSLRVNHQSSGEYSLAWSFTKIVCYFILGYKICKLLYEAQPLLMEGLFAIFNECSIVLQDIILSYLSTFFSFTCGNVLKECFLK